MLRYLLYIQSPVYRLHGYCPTSTIDRDTECLVAYIVVIRTYLASDPLCVLFHPPHSRYFNTYITGDSPPVQGPGKLTQKVPDPCSRPANVGALAPSPSSQLAGWAAIIILTRGFYHLFPRAPLLINRDLMSLCDGGAAPSELTTQKSRDWVRCLELIAPGNIIDSGYKWLYIGGESERPFPTAISSGHFSPSTRHNEKVPIPPARSDHHQNHTRSCNPDRV